MIGIDDRLLSEHGPAWAPSWPLAFSEDGTTVAVRLTSASKECVAVDGRRGEAFDQVGTPVLSRDGTRVAYRAHLGDRCFAVLGTERGPACELMTDPAISADGRTIAYGAKRGWWRLVVGDREIALDVAPARVFLSDDGRAVGYVEGSQARVVVPGRPPGELFSLVGRPVFSPDGRTVAYAADVGATPYVVVGDRKFPAPGRVSDPAFSADGRKVGYGTRVGREIGWKVLDVSSFLGADP
ncbi:MAG TPA: hypothetical protein VF950_14005 [Planctomycetota bacterium]